jgi:osmotically inducible protein OsmC
LTSGSEALSETQYSPRVVEGLPTDAPELIAAALAGCFATALARELTLAGLHPECIDSTATATVDDFRTGGVISHLQLNVRAKVPDSSQNQFLVAALAARASSPVVRLLKTTISMTASLEAG